MGSRCGDGPDDAPCFAVIALMAITLLVMAAPPFGGDFGAAIAGAPGFGLFAWLLLGRTIRLRTIVILGSALVVAGLLVGFADLMRPRDQQTHVGRFFDKLVNGNAGDAFLTIRRKIDANLASFGGTKLLWVLPIVAVLVWYLWRVRGGRIRPLYRSVPVVRQTVLALAVVAFLGYALNDSGVAIPAMMAVVFECALAYVAMVGSRETVTDPPPSRARSSARRRRGAAPRPRARLSATARRVGGSRRRRAVRRGGRSAPRSGPRARRAPSRGCAPRRPGR